MLLLCMVVLFICCACQSLSAQHCVRMQSASHGHFLDLCTRVELACCVLLTLDYMIIPGVEMSLIL